MKIPALGLNIAANTPIKAIMTSEPAYRSQTPKEFGIVSKILGNDKKFFKINDSRMASKRTHVGLTNRTPSLQGTCLPS
jgi:hypothetical protein